MKFAYHVKPAILGTGTLTSVSFGDQTTILPVTSWPVVPDSASWLKGDDYVAGFTPTFNVAAEIIDKLTSLPDQSAICHLEIHSSNDSYFITFDDGKGE